MDTSDDATTTIIYQTADSAPKEHNRRIDAAFDILFDEVSKSTSWPIDMSPPFPDSAKAQ